MSATDDDRGLIVAGAIAGGWEGAVSRALVRMESTRHRVAHQDNEIARLTAALTDERRRHAETIEKLRAAGAVIDGLRTALGGVA